jgi:hypothetical protein
MSPYTWPAKWYFGSAKPPSRLDRIIVLKAFVRDSPQQTICRRDLLSNKVYFEE